MASYNVFVQTKVHLKTLGFSLSFILKSQCYCAKTSSLSLVKNLSLSLSKINSTERVGQ